MKHLLVLLGMAAICGNSISTAQTRPRVIVLTDIENEPDDAESMVRFLRVLEPVGGGRAGGHNLRAPARQDSRMAHPPDRGSLRKGA